MRYRNVPKRLIEETKAIIWLHWFLREEIGLKEADTLSAQDLKHLFKCLKNASKVKKE